MPIKEFSGMFRDVLVVTEFKGGFPNVPIAVDVDYAALIAGDDDPMFLTLPIGKANVTSGNKRHYDEAFLQELERQTIANKPVGLMGHLSDVERATAFPQEAIHWVGAVRDGDTLWGKGYIPRGPVRERIAKYRATKKAIATSIDAFAEGVWDESIKAHRMSAQSLRLNQIDIAPADRAGIADLARVPVLTTEMQDEVLDTQITQENSVSKEQVIQELRTAKPAPQHGWAPGNAAEVAELTAIRDALGVGEDADLTRVITEMRQTQETQRLATIRNRITELATSGIKIDAVRGLVTELVAARNPQTVQEAETAYATVAASVHVTELLKAQVQTVMGPPQRTPLQTQTGAAKYFPIPAEKQEA